MDKGGKGAPAPHGGKTGIAVRFLHAKPLPVTKINHIKTKISIIIKLQVLTQINEECEY